MPHTQQGFDRLHKDSFLNPSIFESNGVFSGMNKSLNRMGKNNQPNFARQAEPVGTGFQTNQLRHSQEVPTPHLTHHLQIPNPPKVKITVPGGNGNTTLFIEFDVSDNAETYETTMEIEEVAELANTETNDI